MKPGCIMLLILVLLCSIVTGCGCAEIEVHFIDVGQADAAVIICDGQAMMIDGGNVDDSRLIYSYLRNTLQLTRLDYVVASHPHEDHIGGLSAALNACEVGILYSPITEYDSKPFSNMIKSAAKQNLQITVPEYGETFNLGNAVVTFVSVPLEEDCYADANDMSLVVRVTYGDLVFLFAGDAGVQAEYRMLATGTDLDADVLKVGHHGSVTSSSKEFVDAVAPAYAVVSVGKDNDYGLPDMEILRQFMRMRCSVLRTDQHGDIIFKSKDGKSMSLQLKTSNRRR